MRLPEQRLWDAMRNNSPANLWLQRIENLVGVGMPDVLATTYGGRTAWVELKCARLPARAATPVLGAAGLSAAQVAWHLKAATMNAPSYVLVRDDKRQLYLLPGRVASRINAMCRAELHDASVAASWSEISAALIS